MSTCIPHGIDYHDYFLKQKHCKQELILLDDGETLVFGLHTDPCCRRVELKNVMKNTNVLL